MEEIDFDNYNYYSYVISRQHSTLEDDFIIVEGFKYYLTKFFYEKRDPLKEDKYIDANKFIYHVFIEK